MDPYIRALMEDGLEEMLSEELQMDSESGWGTNEFSG